MTVGFRTRMHAGVETNSAPRPLVDTAALIDDAPEA
jgi:hypothetical protein